MSHREYIVNGNEKLDTMTGESLFSHGAGGAGPPGDVGPKGDKGDPGDAGPTGNTGSAGVLSVTDTSQVDLTLAGGALSASVLKAGLSLVKADVGLGNVDNTSDANKPISTATQTALDLKAPVGAKYIVQTADATLTAEQALGALATGVLKSTTSTGVLSIAVGADLPTHTHAEADITSLVTDLGNKQPLDADLTTIAGLTATTDNFMVAASSAWASRTPAQAKTSLALVKADVGLGSVDNTSDAGKPISTATQTALNLKADAGAALTEAVEASSTPVAGATSTALTAGIRVYAFFTLPTTEKWYVITGVEWKNMGTVNGNVWCGVDRVDANPPVLPGTVNVAVGARLVQTTINAVQRCSQIASNAIRGGTILGAWFVSDSATGTFGNTAVGSANNRKTIAAGAPALADATAWTANTAGYYVKCYYVGIK